MIAIAVSEFNARVAEGLLEGCRTALLENGFRSDHIVIVRVPGAFELPTTAKRLSQRQGVRAVVTSADLPKTKSGIVDLGEDAVDVNYLRQNILALDKALYRGHAVVGVAAISQHIAEEALSLIEVDYEVLPPVLTALEAMKDDAPILLEDLTTKVLGQDTGRVSNVASQLLLKLGDPDKAFEDAMARSQALRDKNQPMIDAWDRNAAQKPITGGNPYSR